MKLAIKGHPTRGGEVIECEVNMEDNKATGSRIDFSLTERIELDLGDTHEVVVENGKTYVVKKKPIYPKTYEECCAILGYDVGRVISFDTQTCKTDTLFENFYELYICREAYWKIAGKQLGLDKPWKPDWDNLSTTHEFIKIYKGCFIYSSRVLVFPTEEMRDVFYDNFKNLIEQCKELL